MDHVAAILVPGHYIGIQRDILPPFTGYRFVYMIVRNIQTLSVEYISEKYNRNFCH
jgi:hypothetical protein